MIGDLDLDKAAAALLAQHGEQAIRVAEERASRHAIAKQRETSELWRAIAENVRRKTARDRTSNG